MKKARMNISHSRFILSKLKIFGEIVTTFFILWKTLRLCPCSLALASRRSVLGRAVFGLGLEPYVAVPASASDVAEARSEIPTNER